MHGDERLQMNENFRVCLSLGINEPDSPNELATLWRWSPQKMLNSLFHNIGVNLINNLSAALKSFVNTWTKKKKKRQEQHLWSLENLHRIRRGKNWTLDIWATTCPSISSKCCKSNQGNKYEKCHTSWKTSALDVR